MVKCTCCDNNLKNSSRDEEKSSISELIERRMENTGEDVMTAANNVLLIVNKLKRGEWKRKTLPDGTAVLFSTDKDRPE